MATESAVWLIDIAGEVAHCALRSKHVELPAEAELGDAIVIPNAAVGQEGTIRVGLVTRGRTNEELHASDSNPQNVEWYAGILPRTVGIRFGGSGPVKLKTNEAVELFKLLPRGWMKAHRVSLPVLPTPSEERETEHVTSPGPNELPVDGVLERLIALPPREFEILIGALLRSMGAKDVRVTKQTNDGGVDVVCTAEWGNGLIQLPIYVQVKRYAPNTLVHRAEVQALRSAVPFGAKGLFVTTSSFSQKVPTIATASGFPTIGLVDGKRLTQLIQKHWRTIGRKWQLALVD